MAWNEPGNQKGQDPWNDKGNSNGNNQGPPDLDEVLRKLQDKLKKAFGGKGNSSGGGRASKGASSGGGFTLIAVLVVLAVILWAGLGVYTVDQQERGVVLRLGEYFETVQPGLHWNPPLVDQVTIVNTTKVRSHNSRASMLTEDENIVDVSLQVQYVVSDPKAYVINDKDPVKSLVDATDSALRHVVGSSEMHSVLTEGREVLAIGVQERLQDYVTRYGTGLQISKVNVEDSQPPSQVQSAFDDVIRAREDEVRSKNQAETYRNGIVPEARGNAQRILEDANAYKSKVVAEAEGEASRFTQLYVEYQKAPEVTRERLYIDALEKVLSESSKVLVDVEGGNNMLYLPLDKLTSKTKGNIIDTSKISDQQLDDLASQVINRIRESQNNSSSREGR